LHLNGISHDGIKADNSSGSLEVINPSGAVDFLTEKNILSDYDAQEASRQSASDQLALDKQEAASAIDSSDMAAADKQLIRSLLEI
jgi:hypothetical protein